MNFHFLAFLICTFVGVTGFSQTEQNFNKLKNAIESAKASVSSDGLRFQKIEKDSLYYKLGLREGDLLKAFNGKMIKTPSDAAGFYKALKTEKRMELTIVRNGKTEHLLFEVK